MYGYRRCPVCRRKFYSTSATQKFCSEDCRKSRQKKQQATWKRQHKGYYRAWRKDHPDYQKKYREQHKGART